MKIDRLIGILSMLLQKEVTTAPELAEHFEVSRRTIYRDIETLCKAGIPILLLTAPFVRNQSVSAVRKLSVCMPTPFPKSA